MANSYKWLIGKKAMVQFKTQILFEGVIVWASDKYIGLKSKTNTYVIPYDNILIIEIEK